MHAVSTGQFTVQLSNDGTAHCTIIDEQVSAASNFFPSEWIHLACTC